MPKETVKELEAVLGQLKSGLELGDQRLQEALSNGDTATAEQIGTGLLAAKQDYERLLPEYERAIQDRQSEILDGLNKGTLGGFKQVRSVAGGYGSSMPAYGAPVYESTRTVFDKKSGHEELRSTLSELTGIPQEKINTKSGITRSEAALVQSFQDPRAKEDALASLFKSAKRIDLGGQENFLIETEGGSYKLAYPPDQMGRKVAGTVAAEAFPVAFGIMSAMALPGGRLPKMPKTSILASNISGNVGYEAAKMAQEYALSQGASQPISNRMVDNIGQSAQNIAFSVGLEAIATPFLGAIVKQAARPVANAVDNALIDASKTMQSRGFDMSAPAGASAGDRGLLVERKLAADFQDSAIGQKHIKERRALADFQKTSSGSEVDIPALRKEVFSGMRQQWDSVVDSIARKDARIAQMVKKVGERRFDALAVEGQNQAVLGEGLRGLVEQAQVAQRQLADQSFTGFYSTADQAGVQFSKKEVLDTIKSVLGSERNKFLESKGVQEAVREIAKSPDQAFSFQNLRNIIQKVQDSAAANTVGAATSPQVASAVAGALRDAGEARIAQAGLGDAWQQTLKTYDDAVLAFNRSSPGAILGEKLGAYKMSGSDIVTRALKDEKTTADVLDALYKSGDQASAAKIHQSMRDAYLENIGLYDRFGKAPSQVQPKKNMLEALWGRNPDGTQNPMAAARVENSLREMNAAFEAAKVPISELTPQNVNKLLSPLSVAERRSVISELVQKAQLVDTEKRLVGNKLVQLAKEGNWKAVDNDEFAAALIDARPQDIKQVVGSMTPSQRVSLKKDYMYQWYQKYSTGGTGKNQIDGFDLWDGDAFIRDLGNWTRRGKGSPPQIIKSMDAVLGPAETDKLVAASRLNRAYRPLEETEADTIRTMMSETGVKVYASGLPNRVVRRLQAAAYGTPAFDKLLRGIVAGKDPASIAKLTDGVIAGMAMTRGGWQAFASATRNDPDAQAALHEMLRTLAQEKAAPGAQ